ncbi:MAG: aminoacyl-tRNA hydrolase [Candidatus Nomurabacteria bacterium]|jgi:PTH1 family peptidyl-tRNA hydrolase|nr:aminoacyl-tRNA hydrolase [Candidatus Nomurabacteria bacterium]
MKLVVFQGNPGLRHRKTRHNVGFIVADYLAARHGLKWQKSIKFGAETTELDGALLIKPQTFYNETGYTVRKLVDFYKTAPSNNLLVVCDDLNLPFGTLRTREKGSDGGNNGLKSITTAVGDGYARLRIGTDNELHAKLGDTDFVLSRFSKDEWALLPDVLVRAEKIIQDFINDRFKVRKAH